MTELPSILEHVPGVLLVFARISGVMLFTPVLASSTVPVRVRASLAAIIALAVYPTLSAECFDGVPLQLDFITLIPVMFAEALVGLVIGWMASIPLLAAEIGGKLAGMQLGLGFAETVNPVSETSGGALSQAFFYIALAAYLSIDGHTWALLATLRTFDHVAIGAFLIGPPLIDLGVGLLMAAFEVGLRIAAPILAIVFLESVAMGFVSKTTPQINILSLGFPLRILVGTGLAILGLHVIGEVIMIEVHGMLDAMHQWATDGTEAIDGAVVAPPVGGSAG